MILYFSATGNNKYCAEYIAAKCGDKVVSMNDMIKNDVRVLDCAGEERLGIVAPTYDFDLAYVVKDFLTRLEIQNVNEKIYIYGVFTCGSNSGYTEYTFNEILNRKGIKLNASFVIEMPDNYVLMFKQKSPEAKNKMLAQADEKLKKFSKLIAAKQDLQKKLKRPSKIISWATKKFFIPSQKKVKGFSVNENCIGCGLCEKVCPMNIIKIQNHSQSGQKITARAASHVFTVARSRPSIAAALLRTDDI